MQQNLLLAVEQFKDSGPGQTDVKRQSDGSYKKSMRVHRQKVRKSVVLTK
ncbi:MAG: hypothetical protein HKN47_21720 [Pirellulaceae bacterium]|nr:hypothetical protein [Pirellulaceae bacterium]